MTWVQTYSGIAFDLLDPRPEMVEIKDIAHALAHQCRYNGHTSHFYSVAQHSVLVSNALETVGSDRELLLWGLLHDAAEAYVGDLVSPVKRLLRLKAGGATLASDFDRVEAQIQGVIVQKYGLGPNEPAEVTEYDLRLLATERRDLFGQCPRDWQLKYEPLYQRIVVWPATAETEFLRRFDRLASPRNKWSE